MDHHAWRWPLHRDLLRLGDATQSPSLVPLPSTVKIITFPSGAFRFEAASAESSLGIGPLPTHERAEWQVFWPLLFVTFLFPWG